MYILENFYMNVDMCMLHHLLAWGINYHITTSTLKTQPILGALLQGDLQMILKSL